jgi:diamine N-acetyltransferase
LGKGVRFYGFFYEGRLAGTIAIENSKDKDNTFYLERLAVLPGHRHKGIGRKLLDFAFSEIKSEGGKTVSIAIMNENAILKKWYMNYGFKEILLKKYDHLPFTVCFM